MAEGLTRCTVMPIPLRSQKALFKRRSHAGAVLTPVRELIS